MLNRRGLRIRVMQVLFALQQGELSNKSFALQILKKVLGEKEKITHYKQASRLFIKNCALSSQDRVPFSALYHEELSDGISQYQRACQEDATQYHNLLNLQWATLEIMQKAMVCLLADFWHIMKSGSRQLRYRNFLQNPIVLGIVQHEEKNMLLAQHSFWNREEHARKWFTDVLRSDPDFQEYLHDDGISNDFDAAQAFILLVFQKIFAAKIFTEHMAREDLFWMENKHTLKSLVYKTMKGINAQTTQSFGLAKISLDKREDKNFCVSLYLETIKQKDAYNQLLMETSKNWDIERIQPIDRIIIYMTLAECVTFPSIPIKVSINEYLEIAKRYSSEKSSIFINGVLNTMIETLKKDGKIKKSARGMLEK